jgi:hypothetical protein
MRIQDHALLGSHVKQCVIQHLFSTCSLPDMKHVGSVHSSRGPSSIPLPLLQFTVPVVCLADGCINTAADRRVPIWQLPPGRLLQVQPLKQGPPRG